MLIPLPIVIATAVCLFCTGVAAGWRMAKKWRTELRTDLERLAALHPDECACRECVEMERGA